MPDLAPVMKAIKRLATENRGSRQQMTGYARAFRLTDEKLAAAVSMHSSGALYKDIAADLGVTPRTLRQHLKTYEPNRNEPDFAGPGRDAVVDRPGRSRQKERDSERILRQQQEQASTPATSPTKGGAMTEAAQRAKAVSDHGTAGRPVGVPSPAVEGGRPDIRHSRESRARRGSNPRSAPRPVRQCSEEGVLSVPVCEPCKARQHDKCENQGRPMIQRTCTCTEHRTSVGHRSSSSAGASQGRNTAG